MASTKSRWSRSTSNGNIGEIGSGEIKGCLRQVDAVIVAHLRSAQRGLHHTGVAAGNVEKTERRRENIVQGFSKDTAYFAVGQAIAFDQLAVRGPLLLELRKRRGIHHCAARLELMDMNVYQFRCLTSLAGEQTGLRGRADGGQGFNRHPPDRGLDARVAASGVVTSLKEEHENSASRIFSNDRDCLAPHVHSRRAKGSVRPCRSEMTLDVESVVGGCVS